jgi:hypothetical protein
MRSETEAVLERLKMAESCGKSDPVCDAMSAVWKHGLTPDYVSSLITLLGKPWHEVHEDIVNALQRLKEPRSVEALFEVASYVFAYRDYDDTDGLARKCTWALADIGTEAAKNKLELLSHHENAQIAGYVRKRLVNWEKELPRKGTQRSQLS